MDELVTRTRLTKAYILSLIDLLAAPKVLDLVRADTIATTEAMKVLREEGGDATRAAERIKEGAVVAEAAGKKRVTRKHLKTNASDLSKHPAYAAGLRRAAEIVRDGGWSEAAEAVEAVMGG